MFQPAATPADVSQYPTIPPGAMSTARSSQRTVAKERKQRTEIFLFRVAALPTHVLMLLCPDAEEIGIALPKRPCAGTKAAQRQRQGQPAEAHCCTITIHGPGNDGLVVLAGPNEEAEHATMSPSCGLLVRVSVDAGLLICGCGCL